MKNSKKNSFVKEVVSALRIKSSVKAGIIGTGGGCPTCGIGGPKQVLKP
jgi:hypothetical protein